MNHIRLALHQALEVRGLDPAAYDPWFFPSDEEYAALLRANGFIVESIVLFPRPTPLPGEMSGWLRTFAQPFLEPIPEPERDAFLMTVSEGLRPHLFVAERGWFADYTRLRFRARKA